MTGDTREFDMSNDEILLDVADGVATVTLNRPAQLNAITASMHEALRRTMTALGARSDVRVIVVTGAGRGFCAGADMGRLTSLAQGEPLSAGPGADEPVDPTAPNDLQRRYNFFAAVPKPVIACVNGAAAGIGFVLALFSDLRYAAIDATFMTGFARRGLIAEHGSAWGLARLVGPGRAADLLLSSRRVSGAEAERMRLVDRALPREELLPATLAYAREMAATTSPRSLALIKRQLWSLPFQTMGESFDDADRLMHESLLTEDFKEGVAHFLEKRAPRFTGR